MDHTRSVPLFARGEVVALGIMVTGSLYLIVAGLSDPNPVTVSHALNASHAEIRRRQARGVKMSLEVRRPLLEIRREWAPLRRPAVLPLPAFYSLARVEIQRKVAPPPVVVLAPYGLRAAASRDAVRLIWAAPPARGPAGQLRARLLCYELRRGWGPPIRVASGVTTYLDRAVQPRTRYQYRLRAIYEYERSGPAAETREVIGGRLESRGRRRVRVAEAASPAWVLTPVRTFLEYLGHLDQRVILRVWRWERGSWWVGRLSTEIGTRVGGAITAERATRNPFRRLGERRAVAWRTDFRLLGRIRRRQAGKVRQLAVVEQLGIDLPGLGGVDWGERVLELPLRQN